MNITLKVSEFIAAAKDQKIKSQVYEIKIGKTYKRVRATSMKAINEYCKEKNIKNWRVAGMMPVSEMKESLNLEIVA